MRTMRTIYVEYFCDDDLGEADAFYDVIDNKLKLITAFSNNDASYRDEYMSPLFEYLGIEIKDVPKKHKKEAKVLLANLWGCDGSSDSEDDDDDDDDASV